MNQQEQKNSQNETTQEDQPSLLDLIIEKQPRIYSLVPEEAYKIAKASEFKVDNDLINVIAQDAEYSFYFALKTNFKNVPKQIIKGISKDPEYSYLYFRRQHGVEKNIPKLILGTIASNKEYLDKTNKLVKKINDRIKEINSVIAKPKLKRKYVCWICKSPSCYLSWEG